MRQGGRNMAWYDEAVFYHIYPLGLTHGSPDRKYVWGAGTPVKYAAPVDHAHKGDRVQRVVYRAAV